MDCRSTHHSFLGIQALHVPVLFDIRARYPRLYYCTSFLRFRCWCDVLHVVYKRHKAGKPETGATSLFAKRRNSRRPLMGALGAMSLRRIFQYVPVALQGSEQEIHCFARKATKVYTAIAKAPCTLLEPSLAECHRRSWRESHPHTDCFEAS